MLPDETRVNADDSEKVIFFLKDDMDDSSINIGGAWRSFEDMLKLSYLNSFACGMKQVPSQILGKRLLLSPFHETQMLLSYSMQGYATKNQKYDDVSSEVVPFQSKHKNLGEWIDSFGSFIPDNLVPVCYGGIFAATKAQINQHPSSVWRKMMESLSRGDNIEEGHFAERSWGGLLSPRLPEYQVAALRNFSTVIENPPWYKGALFIEV